MTLLSVCRCRPRGVAPRSLVADALVNRVDPTGTLSLRRVAASDMDRRWQRVRQAVVQHVDRNAEVGLTGEITPSKSVSATMPGGGDGVKQFQKWIDGVLWQIVQGGDGAWLRTYIDQAAEMARVNADNVTDSTTSKSERLDTLQFLMFSELQGICEAVSQQAVRAFADGMLGAQRPSQVARRVAAVVSTIGRQRGELLAEFVVTKTYSAATLDAFRSVGISKVGTIPELVRRPRVTDAEIEDAPKNYKGFRSRLSRKQTPSRSTIYRVQRSERALQQLKRVNVVTAGDDRVCPVCESISESGPYKINTAESLIPAHPRCRCAFVPA